ncbi:MAG: 4Fe-4S binding protein [Pseudomonadota bacterium]|jgi:Fe-S-cluster-containing hydrogenase component 2|uniref:Putative ferredoxin n=1 Tax=anaerobic digester metagenome TaxID=1263854 RepID=A0A485LYG7_9ZZZZ|nr:4Fe-4S binding protein [Pseudomonadota bacterium]
MTAKIDKELCTGCSACIDICPMDAISLLDGIAQINEEECAGCGVCVDECPTGAIRIE